MKRIPLFLLLLLAMAAPAAAQRVRGAALDANRAPVVDVLVEIRSVSGTVLPPVRTDSAGLFQLTLPAPGRYELRASRLGYAPIGPTEIMAERGREFEIVLRMSTEAVALEPIEITVRRAARTQLDDVHNRIDWMRRVGVGRTMTREEIERRAAPTLPALVGSMSPRVRTVSPVDGRETILLPSPANPLGVCVPTMYVDGVRATGAVEDRLVSPEHLEAVELYIGAQAPVQYNYGSSCGVVLFWTRRGADSNSPRLTWKRLAVGGAVVALILLFGAS